MWHRTKILILEHWSTCFLPSIFYICYQIVFLFLLCSQLLFALSSYFPLNTGIVSTDLVITGCTQISSHRLWHHQPCSLAHNLNLQEHSWDYIRCVLYVKLLEKPERQHRLLLVFGNWVTMLTHNMVILAGWVAAAKEKI